MPNDIRYSHTKRGGDQCILESHEFGKHEYGTKWVAYFTGPEGLQDKILGEVDEVRMREILAGPGLGYGPAEIDRIIESGKFDALVNLEFIAHPVGLKRRK